MTTKEPTTTVARVNAAVIGSGQAGPGLATAFASGGDRVVLFEGAMLGGTCVNAGCTPTKTLRKSARIAHLARRASEFGVQVGAVHVDFAAAMERMASVVNSSRDGLTRWVTNTPNLTLVREFARLDGRDSDAFIVRAGSRTVLADRVYLNVGTRASLPPVPGLAAANPLLNDSLLALRELPAHLVILGGSYIGVELGQIFRRLGSRITIVERAPTLVAREDEEVSSRLEALFHSEGIDVVVGASITAVEGLSGSAITIRGTTGEDGTAFEVQGTHLLVATGRIPNTSALGLESVGVTMDAQGYIPVNGALGTNIPGIWALGDVNRRGAFTHTSWQDHEIVVANHRGGTRTADGRVSTYAVFTDPPIGRVGLSLRDARALTGSGRRFLVATHEMRHVSRAKEEGETTGLITVVVDQDTSCFVGATVFGIGGDEIIQVICTMIAAHTPYTVLQDFLPVHPTVTEFFPTILGKLRPLA